MDQAKLYELRVRGVMDKLSNNELVEFKEEWIEEAVGMFRDCLIKQFTPRPDEDFRLRGSNIGRPRCQLQHQKIGTETDVRMPYNHISRMLFGDSFECFMLPIMRMAGLNITGTNDKVEVTLEGTLVKGEDDLEIDGDVWDAKSCSPWAYDNKWSEGIDGLQAHDDFGYIGQLVTYSEAKKTDAGGWVVGNKSTGEVQFVGANFTPMQREAELNKIKETIRLVNSDKPVEKCFEPETEFYRRRPTGSKKVPMTCTFCDFQKKCWPDAVYRPQTCSTAKAPKYYWYTEYAGDATQ